MGLCVRGGLLLLDTAIGFALLQPYGSTEQRGVSLLWRVYTRWGGGCVRLTAVGCWVLVAWRKGHEATRLLGLLKTLYLCLRY